jgi:hypothetical protein
MEYIVRDMVGGDGVFCGLPDHRFVLGLYFPDRDRKLKLALRISGGLHCKKKEPRTHTVLGSLFSSF